MRKAKTNKKNMKMLKSSTHDQLSNITHKIQNRYLRHNYYNNDLYYRWHRKSKRNKLRTSKKRKQTSECRRSNRKNKNKKKNLKHYKIEDTDVGSRGNITTISNFYRVYYYGNYAECCKVDLKTSYMCVYFGNLFYNLQLILIIILLAVTTSAAQSVESRIKSHQKPNTSANLLLEVRNFADSITIIKLSEPLNDLVCHNLHSLNATPIANAEYNIKFPYYSKDRMRLKSKTHKNSRNVNSTNLSKQTAMQVDYLLIKKYGYDDDYRRLYQNDSALVINKKQQSYKNSKPGYEHKMLKAEHQEFNQQIKNSNKFLQIIYTNKNNNKIIRKVKNVNDKITVKDNFHQSNYHLGNFENQLHLLPTNPFFQFVNNKRQLINNGNLMKLVMDGLKLKKLPRIEAINISQKEYVTKYREYLHRVHIRKGSNLQTTNYVGFPFKPLEIFTIVSNSTLLRQYQEHRSWYKRNIHIRKKRSIPKEKKDRDEAEGISRMNQKRVRNVLFLKMNKPRSTEEEKNDRKTNIRLIFALKPELLNLSSNDIEEANIRLVLIHNPILAIRNSKGRKSHTNSKNNSCVSNNSEGRQPLQQRNVLNLKLFFISKHGKRILLDRRKVDIRIDLTKPDETRNQWLQFDVSKAVKISVDDKGVHHIFLELQCDNCKRIGARVLNDAYDTAGDALANNPLANVHQLMPVLNVIGSFDKSQHSMRPHRHESHHNNTKDEVTTQRQYYHQTYNNDNNKHNRRTNCYKATQRCCRHSMEVSFKDIKGFEFIIQPKVFDAGYCHGHCPPRYNPAHNHAFLQSIIWQHNPHKVPRPSCAPSKLVDLEVLHVDEKDNEKLKISTWSDMKVEECACS